MWKNFSNSKPTMPKSTNTLKRATPTRTSFWPYRMQRMNFSVRIWRLRLKHYLKRLPIFALFLSLMLIQSASLLHAETGTASWYSSKDTCKFNPDPKCPMANGESVYEAEKNKEDFAASWFFPLGKRVRVFNATTGASVVVVIRDRGPRKSLNRTIDLSKSAFRKIADPKQGLIPVSVEVLS